MNRNCKIGAGAALAILTAGCADLMSIHNRYSLNGVEALSIDAKQRVVYSVEKKYGDGPNAKAWKAFCAEPSPDALAAISASGGLSAESAQKALSAAFGGSEAAGSIGLRTQTIQILRDAMYRLCEGYASGAMDNVAFSRMQRRYQHIMLGLLAIEQMTGAVVAQQVILSGSASASVGRTLGELQKQIDAAKNRRRLAQSAQEGTQANSDGAKANVKSTQEAYDKAKTDNGSNENAPDVVVTAKALTGAKADAAVADKALANAKRVTADAEDSITKFEAMLKDLQGVSASASTSGQFDGTTRAGGIIDIDTVDKIANAVKVIVDNIVNHDYSQENCFDMILSQNLDAARYNKGTALCHAEQTQRAMDKQIELARIELQKIQALTRTAEQPSAQPGGDPRGTAPKQKKPPKATAKPAPMPHLKPEVGTPDPGGVSPPRTESKPPVDLQQFRSSSEESQRILKGQVDSINEAAKLLSNPIQ